MTGVLKRSAGDLPAGLRAASAPAAARLGGAADDSELPARRLPGRHHAAVHGADVAAGPGLPAPVLGQHLPRHHLAAELWGAVPRGRGAARVHARGGGVRDVHC